MKKDFIQFITEKYSLMTDSERILSDYIIQNFDRVLILSVHALASETNLSVATIVRYAQHMGFEGYKEFRLYLAQLGNEHEDFILDFSKNENSADARISKMLFSCIECLNLTQKHLDQATLSEVSKKIHASNKIAFFGTGTSYIVCQDAEMKFKRIGISAESACEPNTAAAVLMNMKKGDVVFGISHSGNNKFVERILKTSQDMGITTVGITTFQNSNICSFSDFNLYTQTRESPMHKAAITSRVGQFAMLDSLFMMYLTTFYDTCINNIETIYQISDSLNNI